MLAYLENRAGKGADMFKSSALALLSTAVTLLPKWLLRLFSWVLVKLYFGWYNIVTVETVTLGDALDRHGIE